MLVKSFSEFLNHYLLKIHPSKVGIWPVSQIIRHPALVILSEAKNL
jgi:hypothetical protein